MIIPHRTRRRSTVAALATLLAALALGGCVYRVDVQQGNYLEGKAVDQLQVGMTRTQVRYLLGTPLVPDVFDKDRWDYLYYFRHGRHRPNDPRRLVVYFKDDKVTRFERVNVPESAPQAPEEGAPIQKFPKI
ncbi:MAG TPA: outer membrane protein assembly factor BamE [Steroidobacteraceae bacterium]